MLCSRLTVNFLLFNLVIRLGMCADFHSQEIVVDPSKEREEGEDKSSLRTPVPPLSLGDTLDGKTASRRVSLVQRDKSARPVAVGISSSKRGSIIGPDDRRHISPKKTQILPFKAVVKVKLSARSGSCSGTLIGPRHVLSAAHCFHNGLRFLNRKRVLNVGVLQPNERFTWYRVKRVYLPRAWYKARSMNPENDYAVLSLQVPHGRTFLKIKSFSIKNLQPFKTMHFACFPNDKRETSMWYSSCPVGWTPNATAYRSLIMNKCDAAGGCSGAGVYVIKRNRRDRYIIGVLSSSINNQPKNVVIRLTPKKVKEICGWIGGLIQSGCRQVAGR